MFEISQLKQDIPVITTIEIDCIASEDKERPTLTITLSDKIRKEERRLSKKYIRVYYQREGKQGNQRLIPDVDKLAYCQELSLLCVTNSEWLFSDNGKPTQHDKQAFTMLLERYKPLLDWFSDKLSELLTEDDRFKKEEEEEEEKN